MDVFWLGFIIGFIIGVVVISYIIYIIYNKYVLKKLVKNFLDFNFGFGDSYYDTSFRKIIEDMLYLLKRKDLDMNQKMDLLLILSNRLLNLVREFSEEISLLQNKELKNRKNNKKFIKK